MSLALEDEWSRVNSSQNPEHQVITHSQKWTKDVIVGILRKEQKKKNAPSHIAS